MYVLHDEVSKFAGDIVLNFKYHLTLIYFEFVSFL